MYARGMTLREIQAFLAEQYGTEVSPDFISYFAHRRREYEERNDVLPGPAPSGHHRREALAEGAFLEGCKRVLGALGAGRGIDGLMAAASTLRSFQLRSGVVVPTLGGQFRIEGAVWLE